jgi:hypothetical protein
MLEKELQNMIAEKLQKEKIPLDDKYFGSAQIQEIIEREAISD